MAKDKLTPKQERFIDEYLIDLNATAAAKRAGYSEKNAEKIGHQLLEKTRVAAEVEKRKQKRRERTELTAEWVIGKLKDLAERAAEYHDAPHIQAANKSLELLGKHLGLYTDKVNVSGQLTVNSSLEELRKRG